MNNLSCFKAYDIRGKVGEQLDEKLAYKIGGATAFYLEAKSIVVGGDNRLSTESLKSALIDGIREQGCDVIDIGMCGTEEIYFATNHYKSDGGIMITASHNPVDYNGMKLVRKESRPISGDTGLSAIKKIVAQFSLAIKKDMGQLIKNSPKPAYIDHILDFIDYKKLSPLRLLVNAGNGMAGHIIDAVEIKFKALNIPVEFIKIHHQADGSFPNGIPNPLLIENRKATQQAVIKYKADFAIAWDGDFDRCFLFDSFGQFIEGYYIVGLLAQVFLQHHPGEKIIHDPRVYWNTVDLIDKNNGIAVQSKTGHAFIKERMRAENAIYGGEMSAHHYFRDFAYCDSGMIPWLLVADLITKTKQPLHKLVGQMINNFPSSGEINFNVNNAEQIISLIEKYYVLQADEINYIDGLSMSFTNWRFNLRSSNTEALLRLNIESRRNKFLVKDKVNELSGLINRIKL